MKWTQAQQPEKMNAYGVRERLKVMGKPGIISFSGSLPSRPKFEGYAPLAQAVELHLAPVPGAAFYANASQYNTPRLSFVMASVDQISTGIAALAKVFKAHTKEQKEQKA